MKGQKPLISIIIPVYNAEAYLKKCVESIEMQTYDHTELIIVNDGSTDHTSKVCEELIEKYGNIRLIQMEDKGVSAARNAGLSAAKGEYITFVDADDRLLPKTLEILYDVMKQTDSNIAGCCFIPFQTQEQWEDYVKEEEAAIRCKHLNCCDYKTVTGFHFLESGILNGDTRCWSKLYQKEAVKNVYFQEGLTIGEDMLFLTYLMPQIDRIAISEYKGYGYYKNPKGAMNREFKPAYMDQITCWELAGKKITGVRPDLTAKAVSILIVSILLTVGKIAELNGAARKKQTVFTRECREKLKAAMKVSGAYRLLSPGYKIKSALFLRLPYFYLFCYHLNRKLKQEGSWNQS